MQLLSRCRLGSGWRWRYWLAAIWVRSDNTIEEDVAYRVRSPSVACAERATDGFVSVAQRLNTTDLEKRQNDAFFGDAATCRPLRYILCEMQTQ